MHRHALRLALLAFLVALGVGGAPVQAQQSMVKLGGTQPCASGSDVVVPVQIFPANGVTAMDFVFNYDQAALSPTGVYRTALTNSYSLSSDLGTAGLVIIHMEGATPLSGNGDVVWVQFHTTGTAGTVEALSWGSALLNEGAIPTQTQNGAISIVQPATIISAQDSASGPGTQIEIPITAGTFSNGGSFDIDVQFNPSILNAVSVHKTALTQSLSLTYNLAVPGEVRIALFGTHPISGSGDLVRIVCNVTGTLGSGTPIDLTRAQIDEGSNPTTLDDGLFTECLAADGDGDGFSGCSGDCDDSNPLVHPGAVELCNGIDDNCDGMTDNAVAPSLTSGLVLAPEGASARLTWGAVAGASGYDVVRGSVETLDSSGGDFTAATLACTADNLAALTALDGNTPATGFGYWYLVRAENCAGVGSYDTGDLSQVGSRDAEIAASAAPCP